MSGQNRRKVLNNIAWSLDCQRRATNAKPVHFFTKIYADDILTTARISDEDRNKYKKVVEKLDECFKERHNVILERACFNRRSQQPGESADVYITMLYQLAQGCKYGEMTDDQLVVGIRNDSLTN